MEGFFDLFNFQGGKELALFLVSMVPLIELRGSIILGAAMGMHPLPVFLISLVGNLLPIPLVILFGEKILNWLKTLKPFSKLAHWYEAKLLKKSQKVNRGYLIGLCLFVGIPLPGTGAWSGSVIAALLNMKMRQALPAIALGVLLAGILVTLGAYGVVGALSFLTH